MIFRSFIILLLVLGMPLSALADLTLGVVLRENSPIQTEPQAIRVAYGLKKQLDEKVKVRIFTDEETLRLWLNRYQLVDIAIFTKGYVKNQAPGEFLRLSGTESFLPQGVLVLRQGIPQQTARKLQAAVPALADDLKSAPLPETSPTATKVAKTVESRPETKARPRIRPVREKTAEVTAPPPKAAAPAKKPEPKDSSTASGEKLSAGKKSAAKPAETSQTKEELGPRTKPGSAADLSDSSTSPSTDRALEGTGSAEQDSQAPKATAVKPVEEQDKVFLIRIAAVLIVLLAVLLYWRRKSNAAARRKEAPASTSSPSIISAALNKGYDDQPNSATDAMDFDFGEIETPPPARKSGSIISRAMDKLYDKQPTAQGAEEPADAEFDFLMVEESQTPEDMIESATEPEAELIEEPPFASEADDVSSDEFFTATDGENTVAEPFEPFPFDEETTEPEPLMAAESELSAAEEVVEQDKTDFFTSLRSEPPETFTSALTGTEELGVSTMKEPTEPWFSTGTDDTEPAAGEEKNLVDPDEETDALTDGSFVSGDGYPEIVAAAATATEEPFVVETEQPNFSISGAPDEPTESQTPEWMESTGSTPFPEVASPPLADRDERAVEAAADEQYSIPMDAEEPLVLDRGEVSAADDHGLVAGLSGPAEEPDAEDLLLERPAETTVDAEETPEAEPAFSLEQGVTASSSFYDEKNFPPPMENAESEKIALDRDVSPLVEIAAEPEPITSPVTPESSAASAASTEETTTMSEAPAKTSTRPSLPLRISGELGPAQLPALLKLIAGQSKTGTLAVRSRLVEKRLYFRKGKIAGASSNNLVKGTGSRFLMLKLGELLVRKGRITEEERDHALKICSLQPSRRIGEVLLETCGLTSAELKNTLRLQAEEIIFSLFLFPGGKFEYMTSKIPIPVEDDLGIDVNTLLRDAARQSDEWRELRKMIPSLNTVMEIKADSQRKLHSARLAPQQDMILSLVDGNRSIYEICKLTGVLEFEVYKFLYLMAKARIVSPVNTDPGSPTT